MNLNVLRFGFSLFFKCDEPFVPAVLADILYGQYPPFQWSSRSYDGGTASRTRSESDGTSPK